MNRSGDTTPLQRAVRPRSFYPFVGGAETLFWEHTAELAARGHRVTVVTLREPGTKASETVDGVEIHRSAHRDGAAATCSSSWPFPSSCARRADVIHAGGLCLGIPAWLCGTILGKPTVLSVYEVFGDQWQRLAEVGRLAGWAFRPVRAARARVALYAVVCISQFTADRLQQRGPGPQGKVSVVYPAVDYTFWDRSVHRPAELRHELNLSADTFIYLYFGRPGVSKGVDTLVAAAARVREAMPASRLVLMLSPEPAEGRRRVLEQIGQLGLEEHAIVRDSVPRAELPGCLLAADASWSHPYRRGSAIPRSRRRRSAAGSSPQPGHAVEEVLRGSADLVPPAGRRCFGPGRSGDRPDAAGSLGGAQAFHAGRACPRDAGSLRRAIAAKQSAVACQASVRDSCHNRGAAGDDETVMDSPTMSKVRP